MSLLQSTNAAYHANRTHLSSSMLKLLLRDLAQFDREWNQGIRAPESESTAFAEGTFVHALCLEPDKIAKEYAFFEGLRKAGDRYKSFQEANPGRIILSAPQKDRGYRLYNSVQSRPEAVRMLSGGMAEFTMTGNLLGVDVKCRADYINPDKGYIADIKTTSYPAGIEIFRQTVEQYKYDLSASLYCQIAEQVYAKPFDFYFIVISKSDFMCDIYRASDATMGKGHALVTQALHRFKLCKDSGDWSGNTKPSYDSESYEILEV